MKAEEIKALLADAGKVHVLAPESKLLIVMDTRFCSDQDVYGMVAQLEEAGIKAAVFFGNPAGISAFELKQ